MGHVTPAALSLSRGWSRAPCSTFCMIGHVGRIGGTHWLPIGSRDISLSSRLLLDIYDLVQYFPPAFRVYYCFKQTLEIKPKVAPATKPDQ